MTIVIMPAWRLAMKSACFHCFAVINAGQTIKQCHQPADPHDFHTPGTFSEEMQTRQYPSAG